MRKGPSRWAILAVTLVVMVFLDQWSKYLAVERLTWAFNRARVSGTAERVQAFYSMKHLEGMARPAYVVWDPMWRMAYAENPGAAWGMLRDLPAGVRHGFFVVVTLSALGFILWYFRRLRDDQRWLQVAMSFVFAGAVGNLVDRLARGYVIDFVLWHWWRRPDVYWPIFNLADSLIVVGVAMILLHPGDRTAPAGKKDGGTEVRT